MKIIAEKIVFGGNSIGKIDGKTVFIPYAIPGEELDVNIKESKRDYDIAEINEILKPSPYRITPQCKYYGKCGGCNLLHVKSDYQVEIRKQILCDIFEQNGIKISDKIDVISGPDFNYRARFQLNDGGLSERHSNVIVPVSACLCAEESINQYFNETPFEERKNGRIHIFGSKFMTDSQKIRVSKEKTVQKSIQPSKNSKKLKIKENHYFAGTAASPENSVTVNLGGKNLSFDVRGFFQSNLFVFEKVLKFISGNLPHCENVLDMYSGCGSISAFIADKAENVVLVEHNRDALVFAEQNLQGKKHISYGVSCENWVKNYSAQCPHFDACVVDPPRSGMEKAVRQYLCESDIPLIFSMSCDPATNARDCADLIKSGYSLEKIYLLDFYPNTSHIESLAIFVK
jgi:23S rRNA (uracil1939-C5)-methyltransferase